MPVQAALARFIDDGLLSRHIRKVAREYAIRQAMIAEAIRRDFSECLRLIPSAAGLHLAARTAPGVSIDVEQVVRRAESWGLMVRALSYFSATSRPQDGLVIGYGAVATPRIEEGLRRLRRSFRPR